MASSLNPSAMDLCFQKLKKAFELLGSPLSDESLEALTLKVAHAMSTRNRDFHDLDHALWVADQSHPLGILAGLFHDIVYTQIDRARLPWVREAVLPLVPTDLCTVEVSQGSLKNPDVDFLVKLFQVEVPGILTPQKALNEFLSALVAMRTLRPYLKEEFLRHVAMMIEATIPFRGERPERTEVDSIARAVANRDVMGFAHEGAGEFIANSWALMYEASSELQRKYFSTYEYAEALRKMSKFYSTLPAEKVFWGMSEKIHLVQANLDSGNQYLRKKLVEVSLIVAISQLTGGDLPLEWWMGRNQRKNELSVGWKKFLERHDVSLIPTLPEDLLLIEGRGGVSRFDESHSPVAYFIFQRIPRGDWPELFRRSELLLQRSLEPMDFLKGLPNEVILPLLDEFRSNCNARASRLEKISIDLSRNG